MAEPVVRDPEQPARARCGAATASRRRGPRRVGRRRLARPPRRPPDLDGPASRPPRRAPPPPPVRPTSTSSSAPSTSPSRPTPSQVRASGEPYVTHPIASAQILADLGIDPVAVDGGAAARRPRGHRVQPGRRRGPLRARGRPPRRRRHQAVQVQHPQPRAAAGREHPQDVPGDGGRHPGRPDQARRPAPQHAHARRPGRREAAAHRPPDDGDLRAAGRAARDLADEVGARGPRVQGARARGLPRPRPPARHAAQGPRDLHRAGDRGAAAAPRRRRHRGRAPGPPEAHLQHLEEDAAQERGVRRDLRRLRHPPAGGRGPRLLRGAGHRARAVAPDPGPVRRLHRGPQEQPLPVAPHRGHRARRQAARDPDPDPRDAPGVRGRHRGPLAVQGGVEGGARLRRQARLAAPAHGVAARRQRVGRDRVRRGHQARHLPGPGVRVHAARATSRTCPRAPRRSTSPTASTPTSATARSAPRSTTGWSRSTTGSRTATSSRS